MRRLPTPAETADILSRKRTRPPRRPPPPAGKALSGYLKGLDERFGAGAGPRMLMQRWREIVGETLARRTEPVKLVHSRRCAAATLEVRVDGPAAALIQHQSAEIVARVNLALGEGVVDRLRIVQGVVRAPTTEARSPRRKPAPLDASQEADLEAGLAKAPAGGLKAALLRLGREVARRG